MPIESSSFRDPSGFVFEHNGVIYRQINKIYQPHYDKLMSSGLCEVLTQKRWLIPHEEVEHPTGASHPDIHRIISPEKIPYISYPYEWCFSQLKDAALLTLRIQLAALERGMMLKDASAYNVQFIGNVPIFIDTLSFETYEEGAPWIAYKQFCQHFLAPLALISRCDFRLTKLMSSYIDGIPLDLASKMLPFNSWFSYSLLAHIHLHAASQKKYRDIGSSKGKVRTAAVGKTQLIGIISSLINAVSALRWKQSPTEWGDYYADTNYDDQSMTRKEETVVDFLKRCRDEGSGTVSDFGANTGRFSFLAEAEGFNVIAHDIDEVAVERNYQAAKDLNKKSVLPLLVDLTNPTPATGWSNKERAGFIERQPGDVGLVLAVVHHLAISNNIPLDMIAGFFASVCRKLIIEFVPKSDSQVSRLLITRQDVFPNYNQVEFEATFAHHFTILEKVRLSPSERTIYLMEIKTEL